MASYHRYTEASFIQVSWPRLVIWATLQRFVVGGITAPFSTFIILVLASKHRPAMINICFPAIDFHFGTIDYQYSIVQFQ